MPNWCNNYATITCPTKDIYNDLIYSIVHEKWFETFAPLQIDDVTNESGWDAHIAIDMWGTKWTPSNIEINNSYDETYTLEVSFDTAWSPPIGVYKIMNKKFDININAFYQEYGCDFFGRFCISKEEEIDDVFDMPTDLAELTELRKVIGSELDDYMSFTWEHLQEDWNNEDDSEDDDKGDDDDDDEDYSDMPELIDITGDDEDDDDDEDYSDMPELIDITGDDEDELPDLVDITSDS
jgi:hypothetical protein